MRFSITGATRRDSSLRNPCETYTCGGCLGKPGGDVPCWGGTGRSRLKAGGKRRGPAALGVGVLCPPCPQGFAASPHHLAVGRPPTLPARLGLCPLPREPQLPLREFFIYFNPYNEVVGDTPIYKMDTSQRSHWKGWLGQSLGSLSFALHTH